MGSIADKLSKLIETKSAIKSAITAKGVTVSDGDPFSSYAEKIAQIESGGSGGDSEIADAIINRSIENINSMVENVGEKAFYGCEKLVMARFPMALNVGESAFRQCTALIEIDFHEIQEISEYAFYGCKVCEIFIFRSKSLCKLVHSNAFTNSPIRSSSGYIYVPSDLLDKYKSATNWSTFRSKFRAIEDYPEICGGTT